MQLLPPQLYAMSYAELFKDVQEEMHKVNP